MAKHPYRGGRPKGVKNGESTTSKGRLWETEEEKEALWNKAHDKVNEEFGDNNEENVERWAKHGNKYKQWYVNIQPEEVDMLTNDELMDVIYKYNGNYSLWLRRTKEDDFNGDYGKK